MGLFTWIGLVVKIIPAVVEMMKAAEQLFDDVPDSGAQKKEYVMAAVKALVGGIVGVSSMDEGLWGKISKAISLFIDAACLFLFPHDKETAE